MLLFERMLVSLRERTAQAVRSNHRMKQLSALLPHASVISLTPPYHMLLPLSSSANSPRRPRRSAPFWQGPPWRRPWWVPSLVASSSSCLCFIGFQQELSLSSPTPVGIEWQVGGGSRPGGGMVDGCQGQMSQPLIGATKNWIS